MDPSLRSRRVVPHIAFDPDSFFRSSVAELTADGRYRTFLELERRAG